MTSGTSAAFAAAPPSGASTMRTERLLCGSGLCAWLVVCGEELAASLAGGAAPLALGAELFTLALFAAAFVWLLLGGGQAARPGARTAVLLLQSVVATLYNSDLWYLVAMTLPFVLAPHKAVIWLFARNAFAVPYYVVYVANRIATAPVVSRLPASWSVALEVLSHVSWQLFAFAIGFVAATERRQRAKLALAHERLRAAQAALADKARLEERLDVARELHDSVGHHVAGLHVQIELALHRSQGPAREALSEARAAAQRLLTEVRQVVSTWRAERPFDLAASLAALEHGATSPVIEVELPPELPPLPPGVARALVRCAQEAVTNARRHARAAHVRLVLEAADGALRLTVRDDGRGAVQVTPGNGLRGLEERALALGGRLSFGPEKEGGFCVEMWLPLGRGAP